MLTPSADSAAPMAVDDVTFQFLAEHSSDVICRVAPDMTFLYISPSAGRVLGWKPEEMMGKILDDFILSHDVPLLSKSISSGVDESSVTVRMRKKDGTLAWAEMKHRGLRKTPAKQSETVLVIRDISEQKSLQDRLSLLELTDSRTGLSTPRAFDDALEREWNRCIRDGSSMSLLLLDFDHFRQFHELHREGDHCLSRVAAAVIGAVRVTDFAAIYGIEDIAIILPSTDSKAAAKVAKKIQAAVQAVRSSPGAVTTRESRIFVTIGIASVSPKPGASPRVPEFLRLGAAHALRTAKSHRKTWAASPGPAQTDEYSQNFTDTL
jgi:diguanylate cyclase (GGDEF)-like protein/PAS domain S-box-containing protein